MIPYGSSGYDPYAYYVDVKHPGYADTYEYRYFDQSLNEGHGGYVITPIIPTTPVSTSSTADDLANALIDAREQASGDGAGNAAEDNQAQTTTRGSDDDFRSSQKFSNFKKIQNFTSILPESLRPLKDVRNLQTVTPYQQECSKLEDILETLSKNGPLSLPMDDKKGDEKRVWVSPFYSFGRQQTAFSKVGNRSWLSGALIGAEYRNLKRQLTIGLMSGLNYGRKEELGNTKSFTKTKGMTFGGYHSMTFFEGARYDIMASRTLSFQDNQRHQLTAGGADYYALSDHKMYTDVVDTKLTYLFIVNEMWSVRPSFGNTYIRSKSGSYSEKGAGIYNLNTSSITSTSNEVYGGIGVRATWRPGNKKIRLTGVYERGYQYDKSGSPVVVNVNIPGAAPIVTNQAGSKTKTHYFSVNASYYDGDTKLKFFAGYTGSYQQTQKNHSFIIKAEYRF
ncbi:autotransporter outer membrane beta-barrel domain-containing protein [Candidatus Finniella inopinata]|uniref:Autotransporter outer membrane beta-barrel domain-containing protein n=1 Tax=Candidatus Finniella inopinata TaxID=1696036 RepID=A0A4Q7DGA1_9PROT|nr:autotransporter outer membrane beta-barrel domain-containing protein [Candidatus Finniella inopinata]RZI45823.1 autotransporter outer membrane beta-barrel domain-containing protein [Candidatus Finniella inopinata]